MKSLYLIPNQIMMETAILNDKSVDGGIFIFHNKLVYEGDLYT